ncbi:MAG: serine hydrolase domain-containing protein [bacterium]
MFGVFSATAYQRNGYGCVLDHDLELDELKPYPIAKGDKKTINYGAKLEDFDPDLLDAAISTSFLEPNESAPRQTMAVVVFSKGELVAEKYAEGVTQSTPLPGFSMAKSMTATMIGLLVLHEDLDVMSVVPNAGTLTEAGVTYDQLMRMTSGIGVDEDGSGRDANSIMLTQTHDAAAFAIDQELHQLPGISYEYTGGNSVVLAKQFVDIAGGGDPSEAYEFLADKLLRPLGLSSVVLEADGVGTFLGSSFMLASALDWAKLGQLYLQDGVWGGARILPPEWVNYVSTKTPQSGERDYGAGFWVAVDGGRDSRHEQLPRPPEDAIFMHGMMNQAVYILPSQSLVVVRLGATRSYLESGEWELLAGVLGALKAAG